MAKQYPGGNGLRAFSVESIARAEREKDDDPTEYDVVVSSEYEVERGWLGFRWREVLDHSPGAVQMERFKSGSAAVLVDHEGDQVGVIRSATLDGTKLRARIRFSRNARPQEIERDVADDIRRNISVGYIPKRAKLVEEDANKGDLWRITLWEPVELSIVSVPADPTVGVGRAQAGERPPVEVEVEVAAGATPVRGGEPKMKRVRNTDGSLVEVEDSDPRPAVSRDAQDAEEVAAIATANGKADRIGDYLKRGLTPNQVAREILMERSSKPNRPQPSAEALDVPEEDAARYSYCRALLIAAGHEKADGIEGEYDAEFRKRMEGVERKGQFLIPMSLGVKRKFKGERATRTLAAGGSTKGAELVFDQPGDLIELLRNATAVVRLGARVLTGLSAPITFPKQTGAVTAQWIGEAPATGVSLTDLALGVALLAPKTLMAATSWSRQLLAQASFDVENLVRGDLAAVHAIALDFAAIHGLGAASEPTGIYKAVGVGLTTGGSAAMTYAKLVAMEAQVASANAMMGSLGWLMNPTMLSNLRTVLKVPGIASPLVVDDPMPNTGEFGRINAQPVFASNQVSKVMTGSERTGGSEVGVVFGNWSDLIIGQWGALDILVDPYTAKTKGLIEVASFQMCDVLARHGESFSKGTGFTG